MPQTTLSDAYIRERDAIDARYFWVVLGPGDVGSKPALLVSECKADALYFLDHQAPRGSYLTPVAKGMDTDYPPGIKTPKDAARAAKGNYYPVDASERARRRLQAQGINPDVVPF